ncbi:MAG TPA: 50S ribosomal protein L11 methyltransferase [Acetobacteraceae bacterium]|nr:50S ribosomal protein L11 methyltransferase [Acetobacteraceae bacterium]
MKRRAGPLETVWVEVPESALEPYEAALSIACATVGFFLADEARGLWRVEGVRDVAEAAGPLEAALALAEASTGVSAPLHRDSTPAEGWLARTQAAFPDQVIGRRFLIRGTHSAAPGNGRIVLTLDAGLAFGSGEHGSTRGCLRALERAANGRPRRILDLGTGSGILAMAAAKLLHRPVLATDIEPWSVRVARENAAANGVAHLVRPILADGWRNRAVRNGAPYDLVFANILARPLCRMARDLARHLAPCGTAILSGLLDEQRRMVLAAHRRQGLRLECSLHEGAWATLVLRKPG